MIEDIEPIEEVKPIETEHQPLTKPKNNKKIIISLAILLILAFGYIIIDNYNAAQQEQDAVIFQNGIQEGARQTITYLMSQALTCQQIPVTMQDKTINLIAVECLSQK